ncbi:MAG: hypothetical protein H0U95_19045 [Bacteroidetes bacterium]|nr:hypothetical protein [Bacteroidota bacterium]
MKLYFIFFLLIFSLKFSAQVVGSSGTSIESCLDSVDCYTVKGPSYLFYDESKNDFYLKVTFADFKIQGDTSDTWLNNPSDSVLYFKADLQKEQFPALSNQNTKSFVLPGQIYFNHKWRDQSITLNIYSTENSIVNTNNTNSNFKYDNYKVNFSLPFVPKQFKTYKKEHYNKQTVTINVTLGRINLFKADMENMLDEVYNQQGR